MPGFLNIHKKIGPGARTVYAAGSVKMGTVLFIGRENNRAVPVFRVFTPTTFVGLTLRPYLADVVWNQTMPTLMGHVGFVAF